MGNLLSKKQNNWFKYERETHSVVFRNQDLVREFTNYTYSFIAMKRCQCAILTSIRLPFRESVCSFFCGKVKMVQTTD